MAGKVLAFGLPLVEGRVYHSTLNRGRSNVNVQEWDRSSGEGHKHETLEQRNSDRGEKKQSVRSSPRGEGGSQKDNSSLKKGDMGN